MAVLPLWLRNWIAPADSIAGATDVLASPQERAALVDRMQRLNRDPFVKVIDDISVISVFDDLHYDRADMDMVTGAMRAHVARKLAPLGFVQKTGSSFVHAETGLRVLLPKSHALGASPFHIARYTPRAAQDFYLLTPTQTACLLIEACEAQDALEQIKALIETQPINILRLADYLTDTPGHQVFEQAIGHLKYVQREAVSKEPLSRRRALGTVLN